MLKQALLQARGTTLLPIDLPALAGEPDGSVPASPSAWEDLTLGAFIRLCLASDDGDQYAQAHRRLDRLLLTLVLEATGGNQHEAARRLGIAGDPAPAGCASWDSTPPAGLKLKKTRRRRAPSPTGPRHVGGSPGASVGQILRPAASKVATQRVAKLCVPCSEIPCRLREIRPRRLEQRGEEHRPALVRPALSLENYVLISVRRCLLVEGIGARRKKP